MSVPDINKSFVSNLSKVVEDHGGNIAIETAEGTKLTYAEIWDRALDLRSQFLNTGLAKGETVAICLPRSPDFVIGLIAAWLCDAVALPLDMAMPAGRLEHILAEAQPRLVLGRDELKVATNMTHEIPQGDLHAPAYIIYTSGSSGQPKGVLVSHAGLTTVLAEQIELFRITPESRCLWMHGTGFDASLSDIGTALLAGAALCFDACQPHDLSLVERMQISHVDLPPSLLPYLNESKTLETIIVGGEVSCADSIRKWSTKTRLINVYGPTEATICTSMVVCTPGWDRAWLGSPIRGVEYQVCNEDGSPAEMGELHITGPCVAMGYPWLSELSSQRFVNDGNTYRTGDLVRRHPCGGYEFLGRVDRQFKINGRLICPEEVEKALLESNQVKRAHVLPWKNGTRTLLAACVETTAEIDDLRDLLAENLPKWMIPAKWNITSRIPALANGKPDAKAILKEMSKFEVKQDTTLYSPTEAAVRRLFSDALEIEHIGANDDFFNDLGGDSLSVVSLMAAAATSGFELSPDAIYHGRSVVGVAKLVEEGINETKSRDELITDTAIDLTFESADPTPPRCILVTGASGFLGKALTQKLEASKIICMSRTSDLHGDVTKPCFGWDEATWQQLTEEVDTVVHLAADVKLFATYQDLKESQVEGTRNVLKFCAEGRPKTLHYASTLSVFVDADPLETYCRESDTRTEVTQLHGGYAQSKWVAEQLVLNARKNGIRAAIHRLGLLSLNMETGVGPTSDWLTLALPGLVQQAADESLAFDLTPVDYAAQVMAQIIQQNSEGIFHIANPNPITQSRISGLLSAPTGMSDAAILAGRRTHRSLDLFKCSQLRFDMSQTNEALAGSGIEFPKISDEYLNKCLRHAETTNQS